jgi:hypothetical protein
VAEGFEEMRKLPSCINAYNAYPTPAIRKVELTKLTERKRSGPQPQTTPENSV